MNILVTGGAGFIGSHVVDAYLSEGHHVVVVDNLSTGKKEHLNPRALFFHKDINDSDLEEIFSRYRFQIVNHHAAQIDVRKSVADPVLDARINVLGSLRILENCRKYNVEKLVFASSGGVIYGECSKKPPTEKSGIAPYSPYGVAKRTMELYLYSYSKICGLKFTALRYGNVYGPRQDPLGEAGVVAIFSGRMLKNQKVEIYGDGEQLRDYVYVGDVVKANILCLTKGHNEIFNIGTGNPASVNDIFHMLARLASYNQKPEYCPPRPGELLRSSLNAKKAERKLGWKAEVNLEKGLKETLAFFKTQQ